MVFETLKVRREGGVLFADIAAPPMNLLGPALVRDLVSLIQRAGFLSQTVGERAQMLAIGRGVILFSVSSTGLPWASRNQRGQLLPV